MIESGKEMNLMLITDKPDRAWMIRDLMQKSDVSGVIRRLPPSMAAINCAHQSGKYRSKTLPDLFFFDYSSPDDRTTAILKKMAFGGNKSSVPVILLTSPQTQELLDTGEIDGGDAVMFSPTGLPSFVEKMRCGKREAFFKALNTLFQFGPILVRMPSEILAQDASELAISA